MQYQSSFPSGGEPVGVFGLPLVRAARQFLEKGYATILPGYVSEGAPKAWQDERGHVHTSVMVLADNCGPEYSQALGEMKALVHETKKSVFRDVSQKKTSSSRGDVLFYGGVLADNGDSKGIAGELMQIDEFIRQILQEKIAEVSPSRVGGMPVLDAKYAVPVGKMKISKAKQRKENLRGYLITGEESFSLRAARETALENAQEMLRREVEGSSLDEDQDAANLARAVSRARKAIFSEGFDPVLEFITEHGAGRLQACLSMFFSKSLGQKMSTDGDLLANDDARYTLEYINRVLASVEALQSDDDSGEAFFTIPPSFSKRVSVPAFQLGKFSKSIGLISALPTWFTANSIVSDGKEFDTPGSEERAFRMVNYTIRLGSLGVSKRKGLGLQYAIYERLLDIQDALQKLDKLQEYQVQILLAKIVLLAMAIPGVRVCGRQVPSSPKEAFQLITKYDAEFVLSEILAFGKASQLGQQPFAKVMRRLISGFSESVKKYMPKLTEEWDGKEPVTIRAAVSKSLFSAISVLGGDGDILTSSNRQALFREISFYESNAPIDASNMWFAADVKCRFRCSFVGVSPEPAPVRVIGVTRDARDDSAPIVLSLIDYEEGSSGLIRETHKSLMAGDTHGHNIKAFFRFARVCESKNAEREANLLLATSGMIQAVIVWRLTKVVAEIVHAKRLLMLRLDVSRDQLLYPLAHALEFTLGEFLSVYHQGVIAATESLGFRASKAAGAHALSRPMVAAGVSLRAPICILASASDPSVTSEGKDGEWSSSRSPLIRTMATLFTPTSNGVKVVRLRTFSRIGSDECKDSVSVAVQGDGVAEAARWIHKEFGVTNFVWIQRLFQQFKSRRISQSGYRIAANEAYTNILESVGQELNIVPISISKHKIVRDERHNVQSIYYSDDLDILRMTQPYLGDRITEMIPFFGVATMRLVGNDEMHRRHNGINTYSFLQMGQDYPDEIERCRRLALDGGLNDVRTALLLAHLFEYQSLSIKKSAQALKAIAGHSAAAVLDPFDWMDPLSYPERGSFVVQEGESRASQGAQSRSVFSMTALFVRLSQTIIVRESEREDSTDEVEIDAN